MKAAMIGLPGSGKSTLFSAATGTSVDPHAPAELRHGVVKVPDPRLDYLAELYQPKKYTEATVEFLDVPGFSLADEHGREAFRRLAPELRQADVLVIVVRDFENPTVPAYKERIDAKADIMEMWDELIFADLDAVTTRIERLEHAIKKPTKTLDRDRKELELLKACAAALENGRPLSTVLRHEEDRRLLSSFAFLTEKPIIEVRNISENGLHGASAAGLAEFAAAHISLCAAAEADIAMLDPEDRGPFMEELGIERPAKDQLIRACYGAGGLISFLTMGPDEVRAWELRSGMNAVEAAGRIHSDLARGFIRAETVSFEDMKVHVDLKGARAAGKVRQEGKTYIVRDGDILNIKFNV